MTPQDYQTLIPLLVAIPIIGLILWRNAKGRRLRIETMWIFPTIFLAMAGLALWRLGTPTPTLAVVLAVSFVLGAGLGWVRGKMMRITIDPETHTLTSQASPAAIIFILALFAIRFGARAFLADEAAALHTNLDAISDVFLVFVIGLLVVARIEMWLRASRLLSEARAARAAAPARA